MQVSRDGDNRLSGTARLRDGSKLHRFSGTLELMRAFEELVPLVDGAEAAEPTRSGDSELPKQGASGPPEPTTRRTGRSWLS